MSQGKVKSLAKMFAGFPSNNYSVGRIQETITVYLEVLEIYSDEQVNEACARLSREAREFAPSRGEVRAMCEKIAVAQTPPRPALTDENRPLVNDLTPEQRAANVRRLKELVAELGANKKDAPRPSGLRVRPAPFNIGAPLLNSLVEKGLVKIKTEDRVSDGVEE